MRDAVRSLRGEDMSVNHDYDTTDAVYQLVSVLGEVRDILADIRDRMSPISTTTGPAADAVHEQFVALLGWCDVNRDAFWRVGSRTTALPCVGAWPADGLPAVLPAFTVAGRSRREWARRGWIERQNDRCLVRSLLDTERPRMLKITPVGWALRQLSR